MAESDELLSGRLRVETIRLQLVAFTDEFDCHFAKLFEDREQESMRYFLACVGVRAHRQREDAFGEGVESVDGSVD